MGRKKRANVYQLRITLKGSKPRIWRRVQVPGEYSLVGLHQVIQLAMGWDGQHLHGFARHRGRSRYSMENVIIDEHEEPYIAVEDVFTRTGDRIRYCYDFGDAWLHDITLEKIAPEEAGRTYPGCTGGRGACPPEDVGGVDRYRYMIEGCGNPDHPAFGELEDWCGNEFDPTGFYPEAANALLERYA